MPVMIVVIPLMSVSKGQRSSSGAAEVVVVGVVRSRPSMNTYHHVPVWGEGGNGDLLGNLKEKNSLPYKWDHRAYFWSFWVTQCCWLHSWFYFLLFCTGEYVTRVFCRLKTVFTLDVIIVIIIIPSPPPSQHIIWSVDIKFNLLKVEAGLNPTI